MKRLLLLVIISLAGCTTTRDVDPRFEPYIQEYKMEAHKYGVEIDDSHLTATETIYIRKDYAGYCINMGAFAKLGIKKGYWEELTDHQKRMLLFHELTHCNIPGRGVFHNNSFSKDGMPLSILESDGIEPDLYEYIKYKDCYLYELFLNQYKIDPKCGPWWEK